MTTPGQNPSTFTELFVSSQRRVYGYILTLVPNLNEADDIFQETSLLLWKNAEQFDPACDFTRWACGIAYNVVRNFRAKQGRDRHLFGEEFVAKLADFRESSSGWQNQHHAALGECLQRLSQKQQDLLRSVYGGRRSLGQLAAEMQMEPNAFYQRLHRVRQQLLACVKRRVAEEQR